MIDHLSVRSLSLGGWWPLNWPRRNRRRCSTDTGRQFRFRGIVGRGYGATMELGRSSRWQLRVDPLRRRAIDKRWGVRSGSRLVENAAWHYPQSPIFEILGHVRFERDRMDSWFEEEEEVFVHGHDPYKRIDLLRSSRHIEVLLDDVKVADTRRPTVLYETGGRRFATTYRSPTCAWTCLSPPTSAQAALTRVLRGIGA